jgi:hypothetical protein
MPVGIEAWVTQIPPITRCWLALSVLTSLAVVRTINLSFFLSVLILHTAMPTRYAAPALL